MSRLKERKTFDPSEDDPTLSKRSKISESSRQETIKYESRYEKMKPQYLSIKSALSSDEPYTGINISDLTKIIASYDTRCEIECPTIFYRDLLPSRYVVGENNDQNIPVAPLVDCNCFDYLIESFYHYFTNIVRPETKNMMEFSLTIVFHDTKDIHTINYDVYIYEGKSYCVVKIDNTFTSLSTLDFFSLTNEYTTSNEIQIAYIKMIVRNFKGDKLKWDFSNDFLNYIFARYSVTYSSENVIEVIIRWPDVLKDNRTPEYRVLANHQQIFPEWNQSWLSKLPNVVTTATTATTATTSIKSGGTYINKKLPRLKIQL